MPLSPSQTTMYVVHVRYCQGMKAGVVSAEGLAWARGHARRSSFNAGLESQLSYVSSDADMTHP